MLFIDTYVGKHNVYCILFIEGGIMYVAYCKLYIGLLCAVNFMLYIVSCLCKGYILRPRNYHIINTDLKTWFAAEDF